MEYDLRSLEIQEKVKSRNGKYLGKSRETLIIYNNNASWDLKFK